MKSTVIKNILSCGILKFSSDFRVFGWSFLVKKIKIQNLMVLGYILEWFNKNHLNLCNLLTSSKTPLKIKSPQMLY